MKSWLMLAVVALTVVVVLMIRRSFRGAVVGWMAPRLGSSARSGRRMALMWHVGAFLLALVVLGAAWVLGRMGAAGAWVGGVVVVLVIVTYVPFTSIGAPKLTRWQKSFGQHLIDAGAARGAATAADGVARVFSALGLLVAFVGLLVIGDHAA